MTTVAITWIANSLAIYAVAYVMRGVEVASFKDALWAGALLSIVNAFVKPIVVLLTLPLTIVTLGLFYFVVTAFCLWLTAQFAPGFMVRGAFTTIVAAILISVISAVLHHALKRATRA
jgi:putative membrane protein